MKSEIFRPTAYETVAPNEAYTVFGAAWAGETEVAEISVSTRILEKQNLLQMSQVLWVVNAPTVRRFCFSRILKAGPRSLEVSII